MDIAKLVLEYIQVLIWPIVAVMVIRKYGQSLIRVFEKSKVKLSLFGVELEANIADLERVLTAAVSGSLTAKQWDLLERIGREGAIFVQKEGYKMNMPGDLNWIRPVRNAGLIMTLPDGKYIEQATELVLTPLGRLLMEAKLSRPLTSRATSPERP
jgi:hypothetical protein